MPRDSPPSIVNWSITCHQEWVEIKSKALIINLWPGARANLLQVRHTVGRTQFACHRQSTYKEKKNKTRKKKKNWLQESKIEHAACPSLSLASFLHQASVYPFGSGEPLAMPHLLLTVHSHWAKQEAFYQDRYEICAQHWDHWHRVIMLHHSHCSTLMRAGQGSSTYLNIMIESKFHKTFRKKGTIYSV